MQKVKATFMLSGWAPASDGSGEGQQAAHHVVRIVGGPQLEAAKAQLSVVTGMHVYSVQPGVPKVGRAWPLWALWAAWLAAPAAVQCACAPLHPLAQQPALPAVFPRLLLLLHPQDAGDLYNADYAQTQELFRQLIASSAGAWVGGDAGLSM